MIRYDRQAILTCAYQKLTLSGRNLRQGTELKGGKEKTKTEMLGNIGKQSGESVESVMKAKKEGYDGKD